VVFEKRYAYGIVSTSRRPTNKTRTATRNCVSHGRGMKRIALQGRKRAKPIAKALMMRLEAMPAINREPAAMQPVMSHMEANSANMPCATTIGERKAKTIKPRATNRTPMILLIMSLFFSTMVSLLVREVSSF
jgi:hypothetical protein